jgi:hypothetical protein
LTIRDFVEAFARRLVSVLVMIDAHLGVHPFASRLIPLTLLDAPTPTLGV